MKNELVLENYGSVELNQVELANTDGGFLPFAAIYVCWGVMAVCSAVTASAGAGYYNNR